MATKRPLKEIDYQVERALRWAWWANAYNQMHNNNGYLNPNTVRLNQHGVLAWLRQALPNHWQYGDEQKVAYRLRKLSELGRVVKNGNRYCTYTPSSIIDPYLYQKVEEQQKEEKRRQDEERKNLQDLRIALDKLVPGHDMEVSRGYHRNLGHAALSVVGPMGSFRMLIKLAQMQVEAQDREAELYDE